jgi:hypothetical protein
VEPLSAQPVGVLEGAATEVAAGQSPQPLEDQHVRWRPKLAVLGHSGTKAALSQALRPRRQLGRVGGTHLSLAGHSDSLEPLGAHDRAVARPARATAVAAYRRVAHQVLARRADGRHP